MMNVCVVNGDTTVDYDSMKWRTTDIDSGDGETKSQCTISFEVKLEKLRDNDNIIKFCFSSPRTPPCSVQHYLRWFTFYPDGSHVTAFHNCSTCKGCKKHPIIRRISCPNCTICNNGECCQKYFANEVAQTPEILLDQAVQTIYSNNQYLGEPIY